MMGNSWATNISVSVHLGGQSFPRATHQVPDTSPFPDSGTVHDGGHAE